MYVGYMCIYVFAIYVSHAMLPNTIIFALIRFSPEFNVTDAMNELQQKVNKLLKNNCIRLKIVNSINFKCRF